MIQNKKRKKWWKDGNLRFYSLMILFPVVQFCVFYILVNFNSILLAFKNINAFDGSYSWTLDNIKTAFSMMTQSPEIVPLWSTSIVSYVFILCIGTPLALFFSFYIYKKAPGAGAFRVALFLPSVISAIVMSVIFQFFMERAVPAIVFELFDVRIKGLLENSDTRYGAFLFYNILIGFGTNVLMYSNAMSGMSREITEAAHIDGATPFQEFIHIALPGIFPTLKTFLVAGVAGIFINQLNVFSFYGASAPENVRTFGYYFYTKTQSAVSIAEYPLLSAMGLIMTSVAIPLTLLVRWALEKYGPKEV